MWADQDGQNGSKPSKDPSHSKYKATLTNIVERGSNDEGGSAIFQNTKTVYVYDSNFTLSPVGQTSRDSGALVPLDVYSATNSDTDA